MSIDPHALLAEVEADPKHLGYKPNAPDAIRDLLNTRGLSGETCPNTAASMAEILIAVDTGEWAQLTQAMRDYLAIVAQQPTIDLADSAVGAKITAIFPAGGPTRTALQALTTRPCSRAEALWGAGTVVTDADMLCAAALNGGVF